MATPASDYQQLFIVVKDTAGEIEVESTRPGGRATPDHKEVANATIVRPVLPLLRHVHGPVTAFQMEVLPERMNGAVTQSEGRHEK